MAITKFFSKLPLPTPRDFPNIPKKDFHPIWLASEVTDWASFFNSDSTEFHSRMWLIMGAYGQNKKGVVGPMYPTYLFYSNDEGANWTQVENLPQGVEYFSEVQTGGDGSVIFIERFPDKKHIGIYRYFMNKKGDDRWKRLAPLYDPRAIAWHDPHSSLITIKNSKSTIGGDMLCRWIGLDSISDITNDPKHVVKFQNLDYDGWKALGNCSFGDDNYRFTPIGFRNGLAVYTPITEDISFSQVMLHRKATGTDHYGVTKEGQLLRYEGESLFLPVTLEEVAPDPESKMATNSPIEGQVLMVSDALYAHMTMITTKSKQKVVKKHKYMKYTNTAWISVPKPVEVKP